MISAVQRLLSLQFCQNLIMASPNLQEIHDLLVKVAREAVALMVEARSKVKLTNSYKQEKWYDLSLPKLLDEKHLDETSHTE